MNKKISCEQIKSVLDYYVNGKLNKLLRKIVKEHLEKCPECMSEYISITEKLTPKIIKQDSNKDDETVKNKQYIYFKKNLSAYIDNELSNEDNIKIKKFAIANPLARKDLENIFLFKKFLRSAFEKTKDELKTDYSKQITNKIIHEMRYERTIDPFYKIAIFLFIMLGFLISCAISLLYFQ